MFAYNITKYLGVILDSRLTFKAHLEHKLVQANNTLWTCKSFVGKRWGLSPKMMHWMYTAIVRPMITYAGFIWFKEAEKISFRLKLNKLQRLACILISGAMRSTPTVALEALLGLPPLHLCMKSEAKIINYKLNVHPDKEIRKLSNIDLNREEEHDNILKNKESDILLPKYNFELPYQISIPSREECNGC